MTSSGYSFVPADPILSPGVTDMLIDPVTLDYVRTTDGEWQETQDSRTTMLLMLELHLSASPFDPGDGTTIAALRENGDPLTPEDVLAETLRAGNILVAAGIIADLTASVRDRNGAVLTDGGGRLLVRCSWRDLASGAGADLIFQPG